MYRQSVSSENVDLLNSNYLHGKQADESPSFVRAAHRSVYFDDVEIQPSSEKPLSSPSSALSKREKIMIAVIVLLTILLIVFIVLFATKSGKEKSKETRPSKAQISLAAGKF